MKIKELRDMTSQELETRRSDLRHERFHLTLQQSAGQLEKPSELKAIRREVARIETILSERSTNATKEAAK
jgi:large subunit ribosomal protein L29